MSEMMHFFAVQVTLLAVVLVLHTYMGLHVIRRTIVFSDLVLDQLAAFGALVGIGMGVGYGTPYSYLFSFVAVLVGSLLLVVIKPKNKLIPREAVIGIMFALALVASLLLGDKLSGGSAYVTKTLAGSMLWVNWPLVILTACVYLGLLLFHIKFKKKFIALTEENEKIRNVKLWDFMFFTTLGIITVLIVPVAGVLLAYSLLMIPAAIAALFTKRWGWGVLLGWSAGFAACILGLVCSYFFNLPYGPTLILSLGIFFFGAIVLSAVIPHTGLHS